MMQSILTPNPELESLLESNFGLILEQHPESLTGQWDIVVEFYGYVIGTASLSKRETVLNFEFWSINEVEEAWEALSSELRDATVIWGEGENLVIFWGGKA